MGIVSGREILLKSEMQCICELVKRKKCLNTGRLDRGRPGAHFWKGQHTYIFFLVLKQNPIQQVKTPMLMAYVRHVVGVGFREKIFK